VSFYGKNGDDYDYILRREVERRGIEFLTDKELNDLSLMNVARFYEFLMCAVRLNGGTVIKLRENDDDQRR
jgi:hypothetical protein